MDPSDSECLDAMRKLISQMESHNFTRRHHETLTPACPPVPLVPPKERPPDDGLLPPLPQPLPRPEYAVTANLVGQGERELQFYVACQQGLMAQVESFIREYHPSQAVRQYGLEQACFGNQPAIARHLLQQGTILHDNAFHRCECSDGRFGTIPADPSIFDKGREDPSLLVQVFFDFGWHPNQLWHGAHGIHNPPHVPLSRIITNGYRPLLTLLLSHGADPNLAPHNMGRSPVDRRSGWVMEAAVTQWDVSLLAQLIEHGAKPEYAHPLHTVVRWKGWKPQGTPFSKRREVAEYLLSEGISGVDDVKYIMFFDLIHRPRPRGERLTPFILACAAQDWEMAEWLLEKGADPNAMGGRAFQPLYWGEPNMGPSEPEDVRDLVDKVRQRGVGI